MMKIELGENRICFTHVDNYAHALVIAERALYPGTAAEREPRESRTPTPYPLDYPLGPGQTTPQCSRTHPRALPPVAPVALCGPL